MKRILAVTLSLLVCLQLWAESYQTRTAWSFSKEYVPESQQKYNGEGVLMSRSGIPSELTVTSTSGKPELLLNEKNGRPSVINASAGTTFTFEMPVGKLPAGTAIDFWLEFLTDDSQVHYFAVEYLDGKKWMAVSDMKELDGMRYNATSFPSKKYPRRISVTVRLAKSPKGKVAFRLRKVDDVKCGVSLYGTNHGECPQIVCLDNSVPKDVTKVHFVGNSYTYFNTYPAILKDIAWREGHQIVCTTSLVGGYDYRKHLANPACTEGIDNGGYDYVFLQDQSLSGVLMGTEYDYGVIEYGQKIAARVRKASPDAKVFMEVTWARKTGKESVNKQFKISKETYPDLFKDYFSQQDRIITNLTAAAQAAGCDVMPVALAWRIVVRERPDIELYYKDKHHPGINGSYLIAAVAYQTIFRTPFGNTASDSTIDPEVASYLRSVAERVVLKGEF